MTPAYPKPTPRPKHAPTGLRRTRLKKHLPKGREVWVARRDAHFAANPRCAFPHADIPEVKCEPPYDAQHVRARGMGGTRRDTSRLVTLCRGGHNYAETHRAWARKVGLATHIWEGRS